MLYRPLSIFSAIWIAFSDYSRIRAVCNPDLWCVLYFLACLPLDFSLLVIPKGYKSLSNRLVFFLVFSFIYCGFFLPSRDFLLRFVKVEFRFSCNTATKPCDIYLLASTSSIEWFIFIDYTDCSPIYLAESVALKFLLMASSACIIF